MTDAAEAAFDAKSFLKTLTRRPGVYQMLGANGALLYVGKAKNLTSRVSSYFRARGLNSKTVALVGKIHSIQITVTNSETEALILEQSLIKAYKPHYNIIFRDDKSYPYIYLSAQHAYPRLGFHRGARKAKGEYYGPYPSAGSVRDSLNLLQKIFHVRQCEDSYFRNRTRPCLQYQIGRCSGPCVGKVDDADYADSVRYTQMFLDGRDQQLVVEMADKMEHAAAQLEFEQAARLRDQIGDLRRVQETQFADGQRGDIDVLAAAQSSGLACVHRLFIRSGRILGSRSYFPKPKLGETSAEVLHSFISQFYLSSATQDMPREIIVSEAIAEQVLLREALQAIAGRRVALRSTVRQTRAAWVKLAAQAALQNLQARLAIKQSIAQRFEALQEALQMSELPQRIECFDVSHSSGEAPVASCVVFDTGGARKTDYRRYNIKGVIGGDDYAAMEQALRRRFNRLAEGEGIKPDILLIDGGKGQLTQAEQVLRDLDINEIVVLGIAKGSTRKAGMEQVLRAGSHEEVVFATDSPALHLMQQVRDESHRFAISGHRARRAKARNTSSLESIPGVGAKRRRELLRYFGGLQEVARASENELGKVPGISEKTAADIYHSLHSS